MNFSTKPCHECENVLGQMHKRLELAQELVDALIEGLEGSYLDFWKSKLGKKTELLLKKIGDAA